MLNKKILIVDDEDDVLALLKDIVEQNGCRAVLAKSADEARTRLNFETFDIMLLDINMPHENGLQFLSKLKNMNLKSPPLIVTITGMELTNDTKLKMMKILEVKVVIDKINLNKILPEVLTKLTAPKVQKKYDSNIVNAFALGTKRTIESNANGKSPKLEAPFAKEVASTYGEFSGIIQFYSKNTAGLVALSFERGCIAKLAQTVFQNPDFVFDDALLSDFAGELCNQVAGQTQAIFQKSGLRFEITPPTLIKGKDYQIIHKYTSPCLILPFHWEDFKFFTEFVIDTTTELTEEKKEVSNHESGEVKFL